ncbi:MAG TPA: YebC/PmpR family DNA-binding transcriptional regulator [Atribacteraceae bacterium]|nr:YebC/PmpR family DNA-binding transcriptional regulator [Atribacteraceae bacterium]
MNDMSGHSKWSSIKHKKAKTDAARGRAFSKLIRLITIAARQGGGSPDNNASLRLAIQKAKEINMPLDNIEKAIKKGTGELEGVNYEEIIYEGYGPGGTALMLDVTTDNRNRTTAEVRHLLSKFGGNLGETGCVSWVFERKGLILLDRTKVDEEEIMLAAIDAGAEDIIVEESTIEVTTLPENFEAVKKKLEAVHYEYITAKVSMIPKSTVNLEGKEAQQMLKLIDLLEEHDDVQDVYTNFDFPDHIIESMEN